MPPEPTDDFEKRVELLEKDADEQIARGAVLVPDRVDHQGDFLRQSTIADLREDWSERVDNGDAYPGVMHAVFPQDAMELVEDRQLQQRETIGSKELPAGTWLQSWQYTDDQLWQLVNDGVLGGFSIGGQAKGRVYQAGEIPDDVAIPDAVQAELDEADLSRDDIRVREITSGRIMETSTVDEPAVPDAVHAETKTRLSKASPALTENIVAARMYLEERGHSADDAKRLAQFLQEHKQADSGGLIDRARSWFRRDSIGGAGRDTDASAGTPSDVERTDAETDTADSDTDTTTMSDELEETLGEISERLDTIEAQLDDEGGDDAADEQKTADDEPDEPATEQKVDELADVVEQQAELLEQMANAQGVSQQADQGTAKSEQEGKTWGDNSPFMAGGEH